MKNLEAFLEQGKAIIRRNRVGGDSVSEDDSAFQRDLLASIEGGLLIGGDQHDGIHALDMLVMEPRSKEIVDWARQNKEAFKGRFQSLHAKKLPCPYCDAFGPNSLTA